MTYSAWTASCTLLERMVVPTPGLGVPMPALGLWLTLAVMAVAHLLGQTGWWKRWSVCIPPPVLGFGQAAALTLALILAPEAGQSFIYFQF